MNEPDNANDVDENGDSDSAIKEMIEELEVQMGGTSLQESNEAGDL